MEKLFSIDEIIRISKEYTEENYNTHANCVPLPFEKWIEKYRQKESDIESGFEFVFPNGRKVTPMESLRVDASITQPISFLTPSDMLEIESRCESLTPSGFDTFANNSIFFSKKVKESKQESKPMYTSACTNETLLPYQTINYELKTQYNCCGERCKYIDSGVWRCDNCGCKVIKKGI